MKKKAVTPRSCSRSPSRRRRFPLSERPAPSSTFRCPCCRVDFKFKCDWGCCDAEEELKANVDCGRMTACGGLQAEHDCSFGILCDLCLKCCTKDEQCVHCWWETRDEDRKRDNELEGCPPDTRCRRQCECCLVFGQMKLRRHWSTRLRVCKSCSKSCSGGKKPKCT